VPTSKKLGGKVDAKLNISKKNQKTVLGAMGGDQKKVTPRNPLGGGGRLENEEKKSKSKAREEKTPGKI